MTGLGRATDVLVCREDAPLKPSPEPVRRALAALGVARAWMLGDTPDDVVAARAAGVVPVGVVPPGDAAGAETRRALLEAGAARVLDDIHELAGLLARVCAPAKGVGPCAA